MSSYPWSSELRLIVVFSEKYKNPTFAFVAFILRRFHTIVFNFFISEALIDAIHNDIKEAKMELDKPELSSYKSDSFFSKDCPKSSNDTPNGHQ